MIFLHHFLHHLMHGLIELAASHLPAKPPKIDREGDAYILRYGWGFRVFSLILFPVFALLPALMVVGSINNPAAFDPTQLEISQAIFLVGFFLSPLVLGGYLVGEAFHVRLTIARWGIVARSPWRRRRALGWEEVAAVSYSHFWNWFVITRRDQLKIRAHSWLNGLPWLAKAIENNLAPATYAAAASEVRGLAGRITPRAAGESDGIGPGDRGHRESVS